MNLVANTTREGSVLVRLMEKLGRMRDQLGQDQVYDVISSIFEAGSTRLDTLMREAILNRRSIDDILGDMEFIDDPGSTNAIREALGTALATTHLDLTALADEERDSKERRLTPEFVERFFVDSLRHLGGRIASGNDNDWRVDFVPAPIRQEARSSNTGEFGQDNRIITFRKDRLRRDPPAEFVAPDHPLFDTVLRRIMDVGRPSLSQGTVFVDTRTQEPYLVWLLEAAVRNGLNEEVHRRLMAIRQKGDAFEPVQPGILLDLTPGDTAPVVPGALREVADDDKAVAEASSLYANEYLAEVTQEQERQVGIMESALQNSIDDSLSDLQKRLERQHDDEAKGKDMRIAIRTTNENIETLTTGLRQRREDLKRRKVTSVETPRVVGVAAVIPGPVSRVAEEGQSGGDNTAVENAAMQVAMDYERQCGRTPADVSKTGVGYDVRSEGTDREIRYIEVKGHNATGDVTLYYTEWQMANRMREEYFIYEVDHALTKPEMRIVQDPVGKGIEPVERVVEYHIDADQLRAAAQDIDNEAKS